MKLPILGMGLLGVNLALTAAGVWTWDRVDFAVAAASVFCFAVALIARTR